MRKPRDLEEYVSADDLVRFLEAAILDIERRRRFEPKMVFKAKLSVSYWVAGWEKPTRLEQR